MHTRHTAHATPAEPAAYPEIYRNLLVVGLLGAMYGRDETTETVASAVELTLTDPKSFQVCRAIAQGIGNSGPDCTRLLREQIDADPDNAGLKVALAAAMLRARDPGWKAQLDHVLATSNDQSVREAAHGLLSYARSH